MKSFLIALLSLPLSVLADSGLPNQPYIYVEGSAEIEKPADMVTLRFDVVARAPDEVKANTEVQANAGKIFGLIKNQNIADNDVIAEDLKSEPEFQQDENNPRNRGKLIGYVVRRSFVLKVRDTAVFPKLVNALLAVTGVEFSGIAGGLSKEKEMQAQVWDKAVANAREQAEKTLKSTGMEIGAIFAISAVSFPEINSRMFGSETRMGVRSYAANGPDEAAAEYRLAPITVSQSVHVIYLIKTAKQ